MIVVGEGHLVPLSSVLGDGRGPADAGAAMNDECVAGGRKAVEELPNGQGMHFGGEPIGGYPPHPSEESDGLLIVGGIGNPDTQQACPSFTKRDGFTGVGDRDHCGVGQWIETLRKELADERNGFDGHEFETEEVWLRTALGGHFLRCGRRANAEIMQGDFGRTCMDLVGNRDVQDHVTEGG